MVAVDDKGGGREGDDVRVAKKGAAAGVLKELDVVVKDAARKCQYREKQQNCPEIFESDQKYSKMT